MPGRRRGHKPLAEKQRTLLRRKNRNSLRRVRYDQERKEQFFNEYTKLCKKYRCYVGGVFGALTGCGVRRAKREEDCLEYHLADLHELLEQH